MIHINIGGRNEGRNPIFTSDYQKSRNHDYHDDNHDKSHDIEMNGSETDGKKGEEKRGPDEVEDKDEICLL